MIRKSLRSKPASTRLPKFVLLVALIAPSIVFLGSSSASAGCTRHAPGHVVNNSNYAIGVKGERYDSRRPGGCGSWLSTTIYKNQDTYGRFADTDYMRSGYGWSFRGSYVGAWEWKKLGAAQVSCSTTNNWEHGKYIHFTCW